MCQCRADYKTRSLCFGVYQTKTNKICALVFPWNVTYFPMAFFIDILKVSIIQSKISLSENVYINLVELQLKIIGFEPSYLFCNIHRNLCSTLPYMEGWTKKNMGFKL